jgi:ATP-dependent DNA helicase RecQ
MVSKYENLPTLGITLTGQDFLNNKLKIETPFVEEMSNREVILLSDEEQELFHALRRLRRKIASERESPPYSICHDTILREMAKSKPLTTANLISIRGIGEKFVENYGNDFLQLISQYTH